MPRKKSRSKQRVVHLRGVRRTDSKVERLKGLVLNAIAQLGRWRVPHQVGHHPIVKQLIRWNMNNKVAVIGVVCLIMALGVTIGLFGAFNKGIDTVAKKPSTTLQQASAAVDSVILLDRIGQEKEDVRYLAVDPERISRYSKPGFDGWSIRIGTQNIGLFADETTAEGVLAKYKQDFGKVSPGAELVKMTFKENVSVVKNYEPVGAAFGYSVAEKTYMTLVKGSLEEKIHVVADGETFWDIAVKNNLSVEKLLAANPQIVPELLQIGDELNLITPKPMLTVRLIEKAKVQEEMPFEVTYTESKTMYKGDEKVVKPGKNGERIVVANVIRENGSVVGREILSQTVLENPVAKVVQKGTKAKPATAPTGKFAKPINRGSFSSDFGIRWGRRHTGVDVSTQPGAPVYASDGGTVTKAGRYDAYGICIIIKHGNGYETYYAHLSKVNVNVGDKVYKGQEIGLSGATGRVTGPHLHFEIRKHGIPLDPENYVKFR